MAYVRRISGLSKEDVGIAGGKGASLGEMTQAGIPVPGGFVVLSEAFEAFIKETGLNTEIDAVLDSVNPRAVHTVENASEKIEALIADADMPEDIRKEMAREHRAMKTAFVAVRSSATAEDSAEAAWAGQLETFLNTTEKDLMTNVKKCWASLFSPRAIFYRFEKNMQKTKVSVAVVVQEMVESEISGIAFSVHPVTQDRNQIIVEAGFGLGEAIVSGSITPDSFVIRKDTSEIIDTQINTQVKGLFRKKGGGSEWCDIKRSDGEKPALSEKEVKELAALVTKIEKHYGFPVDIEWARAKDRWFILQSRPITTLGAPPIANGPTYEFSWGERHSVMTAEMWALSYPRFRAKLANENRNIFMNVENGHVHTYTTAEDLPAAFEAGKAMLSPIFLRTYLKESADVRRTFETLWSRIKKTDVKKLSNAKLISILKEYQDVFEHTYALFKISQPEYPEAAAKRLKEVLAKTFSGSELEEAFISLTTPTETDMMKEEELTATKLSLKKKLSEKEIISYGEKYSWFFFNTYDRVIANVFLQKRFRELKAIPEKERKTFLKKAADELKKHNVAYAKILKKLKSDKEVAYLAKLFGKLGNDRLELKKWWTGSEYLFLDFFTEIARRVGLDTEEFLMTYRLTDTYTALSSGKKLPPKIRAERKKHYAVVLDGDDVKFLESKDAAAFAKANLKPALETATTGASEIRGTIANTGKAVGIARLIRVEDLKELLRDMERFKKDEIIVTTMTQPTMASMARKAAAIVTNEGGITSHASILAREFNIPCVVGTKTATDVIKDGDRIEVDANKGIVKVLSSGSSEIKWVHYITRPFTLLGASFWREWYAGEHMINALGVTNTEAYFLEVYPNVVRYYREKRQMESLQQASKDIVRNDPKKLKMIFDRGNVLNAAAEKILKKGWKAVPDFETAVNTVIEMAIHATVVPFLTLAYFDELKVRDKQLRETAEHLRAQSLYPRFFAEIVTPHAEHLVKKLGIHPEDASLLTVNELRRNDITQLKDRLHARKKGMRFTYTHAEGRESVKWTDDIESMVFSLENITKKKTNLLHGKTAFAGKVTGYARLVLTDSPKGVTFDKGDILVSINSTPALMPLIMKCAAMVTDEGGISCHAAIVSRELKKPCVMSTKLATSVINDGDTIEVDANKGTVKVLKRA